jgi:hypothetical protein
LLCEEFLFTHFFENKFAIMGNAMNNPMNEERVARMQEIIGDVVSEFSKEFPL